MTWQEYYEFTTQTNTKPVLEHMTYGLFEEAGEVAGKCKRLYREHDGLPNVEWEEALKLELGDVLWNLVELSKYFGWQLEEMRDANVQKLRDRVARGVIVGTGDKR